MAQPPAGLAPDAAFPDAPKPLPGDWTEPGRTAAAAAMLSGWLLLAWFGLSGAEAWQPLLRAAALLWAAGAAVLWLRIESARRRGFLALMEALQQQERNRLCLDLHDAAIQPYLGLRLGLEAVRRKAAAGALAGDIEELCLMTDGVVAELRGYVGTLRGQLTAPTLMDRLQRQAARFRSLYSLAVEVGAPADLALDDGLAADVEHMVGEALSNVARHTDSSHASVFAACEGEQLVLRICDRDSGPWHPFLPVSLTLRARQLGGSLAVARRPGGGAEVAIHVPLR
ncbi:MAG TPA: histidine kinase [Rhodocyclaceae bacterium]